MMNLSLNVSKSQRQTTPNTNGFRQSGALSASGATTVSSGSNSQYGLNDFNQTQSGPKYTAKLIGSLYNGSRNKGMKL